ncbi:diguanylate cyclase (GGDEF) domain-containing protein [Malonomonas rubra DSM 5091]|uniref:diguanylate cyclase n=1 Tax=Malonomonas rubra DSM 5091 TaxID=1122189 RepID=A0A1M6FDS2_MALRU|nr:GGDEF domain-containing protein [Malonomonas rubra]SHI95890.1 diguanylate cyclase (GGDEF) domain-containing protein [Malonomonas rubra DSM 5091]
MSPVLKKIITPFLLPNGLLCGVLIYGLGRELLPAELSALLQVFPLAVTVIALLLGWRFNRSRLVYAVALFLLVDAGLRYLPDDTQLFQLIAILLPFNLLILACFRERGLLNLRALIWWLLLGTEVAAVLWFRQGQNFPYLSLLDHSFADFSLIQKSALQQPALLAHLLALVVFLWRMLRRSAPFEVAFFWSQLLLLCTFANPGGQSLRLSLAGAGLILLLGVLENSYSLAYRDELTGLPGRRALNEALDSLGSRYTLAMVDIDHFKKFNDTHGHDVGDQVLKMVASRLATVSGGGKVFRYGGEEFSVLFPRRSVKQAAPFLEVLRVAVEDARFVARGKDRPKKKPKKRPAGKKVQASTLRVTVSIGAAERGGKLDTAEEVLKAADQALYRAKKAGRNRLVC